MALPNHIQDRVSQSYVDAGTGQTAVRVAQNFTSTTVTVDEGNLAIGGGTDPLACAGLSSATIQIEWDVLAASAKTFIDGDVTVGSDSVAETAHGYMTGLEGQLTTSGTLPGGLSTATNYYIIRVDADSFKFATSRANAEAGTAVDITSAAGGGAHTFTPTAGGAVGEFYVQATNYDPDDARWETITTSTTYPVSNADNSAIIRLTSLPGEYVRIYYAPTSGQGTYDIKIVGRG